MTISGGNAVGVFNVASGVTSSLSGLTITGGSVVGNGGGLYNQGTTTLTDCTISGNSAAYDMNRFTPTGDGGGLDNVGTATLSGCTISGNSASGSQMGGQSGQGGGLYSSDQITLTNCTISGNSAYSAGGLLNQGTATLTDCTVSSNSAGTGGGLLNLNTATLTGCTISANSAYSAGGLFNFGTATLTGCTISANSAANRGAGLYNFGTATLTGCTLSGNSAGYGAGLFNQGPSTFTDCTFSGNSAAHTGGGVYCDLNTVTLNDCTMSDNHASTAGGLFNRSGSFSLTDTIVAGNTNGSGVASDISAPGSLTGTYNLIGTGGSGGLTNGTNNNIVLTSLATLLLAPLGNYGGTTQTVPLLPGSAAIGQGVAVSGITTDQRGEPLDSPVPDIGAFQSQGFILTPVAGSTPQVAAVGSGFGNPVAVMVTANNLVEPVVGGMVNFTANPSLAGASAVLSAATATIGSGGQASVTATANATAGAYTVIASTSGASLPASFDLTNQIQPSFSGLTNQTITYGTPSVTFSGTLAATGPQYPTVGETVTVTLDSVAYPTTIGANGTFSVTIPTGSLNVSSGGYTVGYAYATDGVFLAANGSSLLTVNPLAVILSGTRTYDGTVTAAASILTVTDAVNGDTVDVFSGTAMLAGKDVGSESIVNASALFLGNNTAGDYTLVGATGTVTISPYALTYTIGNDQQTYGAAVNLASDLPATFATGVNGDTLDISYASTGDTATAHVGSYPITGVVSNGAGLASDYTVTLTNGTLTVNPYALTYAIGSDSQVYGTAANLAGDLPASFATGVNGDTLDIAYVSAGDTATAHAGSYAITGTASNGTGLTSDYAVTFTNGTLTVSPYALTYLVQNDSQTYGTAAALASDLPPSLATGVNGDTLDISYASTGDTATAHVGSYPITGVMSNGTGLASDYTVTLTNGTLTVNPFALSYQVQNDTQVYGAAVNLAADLPATLATGVNGDTLDLTYASIGDTVTAHVGSYPITGVVSNGTGLASDYTVTLTNGTLTVSPYALTYAIGSDSQVYGTAANLAGDLPASFATGVNGDTLDIAYVSAGDTATAHAGSYAITGTASNGTGLTSDYAVTFTNGTLTVSPYALTYLVQNDSQTYGTAAALASDLPPSLATGVNGDTLDISYASTGDTATAHVGSYPITGVMSNGTGLASDYTVTLTNGTLTVSPYALTYLVQNDSQTYGTAAALASDLPPSLATGVNGDTLDISYASTGDTATAHVGSYPITGVMSNGTGLASDYTVTLTNGTLTVNPFALSYQVQNDTQVYGAAVNLAADLPASLATGVNGDTLDLTYASIGDTVTAHVGSYPITGVVSNGTGLASDYTVTLTNGTLTVSPYALTYAIGSDSQVYGTAANLAGDLPASFATGVNGDTLDIAYVSAGDTATAQRGQLRDHRHGVQRDGTDERLRGDLHQRHADGQPVCLDLPGTERQSDLRHGGGPGERPAALLGHRGQRRYAGHQLRQHRGHGHGARRLVPDHRSDVQRDGTGERLHGDPHQRDLDGQPVCPQLPGAERHPGLRRGGGPGRRPAGLLGHGDQWPEPVDHLRQRRQHGDDERGHLADHRGGVQRHGDLGGAGGRLLGEPHQRHVDDRPASGDPGRQSELQRGGDGPGEQPDRDRRGQRRSGGRGLGHRDAREQGRGVPSDHQPGHAGTGQQPQRRLHADRRERRRDDHAVGDHGNGRAQHQDVRRDDIRLGGADHYQRQPGGGEHGELRRVLRQQGRGLGIDADPRRHHKRRRWWRRLQRDVPDGLRHDQSGSSDHHRQQPVAALRRCRADLDGGVCRLGQRRDARESHDSGPTEHLGNQRQPGGFLRDRRVRRQLARL